MNPQELAKLFIEYHELVYMVRKVEEEIKEQIKQVGKSQNIAGVRATYYKETRDKPNFKLAVETNQVPEDIIKEFQIEETRTIVETITNWEGICQKVGLSVEGEIKPARVVVKLDE